MFVALAIPIAVLVVVFATLEDGANRARSRGEVAREGYVITRAVQIASSNALRDRQLADARALIDEIGGHEPILAIRLFDAAGRPSYVPASARGVPAPAVEAVLRVIRTGQLAREQFRAAGGAVIGWLAPLTGPGGEALGAVQVLQNDRFVEEDAAASSRAIALFAALMVAAVALTVYAVTRRNVARPIEELSRSVRGIGDGNWGPGVPERRDDEFGRLAREFNGMRERLAAMHARLLAEQLERRRIEADLREAERLASLGRFAAGIAHEIGTPLNVIRGRAESLLRRSTADAAASRGLRIIAEQIDRIARIVRGVLEFARARELRLAPTDLGRTIGGVVELVEERLDALGIAVETRLDPALPRIAADADQLHQVFLNLAMNAAEAMPGGGRLCITARPELRRPPEDEDAPRPCVTIEFADDGAGVAPGDLERIFEPFFTTKEVGGGTGLGLAISYGIVREHGGWIEVASEPGRGTRMTVCVPLGPGVRPGRPLAREGIA